MTATTFIVRSDGVTFVDGTAIDAILASLAASYGG
jgi:hypothetical protein